ncbi:MAG: hypothetical protein KIS76_15445 [Pyrinomonadaceae bacterium]|nr:hypothetical protein [Pyrinomonadaceae bacterium]
MNVENTLDKWHAAATRNRFLQLFTAFTRLLLFIGFTPPSITKIRNIPFTLIPDSHPVGHYFNALYATGYYYQFIGWAQLIAAVLLIFPRTAHLGALMFFPIILNIAVLTNSVGFAGTWLVTILMALAAFYLVCWDYDRLKAIFFVKRDERAKPFKNQLLLLPALFGAGGFAFFGLLMFVNNPIGGAWKYALILVALGAAFGLAVAVHHKFITVGDLKTRGDTL